MPRFYMDVKFKDFGLEIKKINNKTLRGVTLDFEKALEEVRIYIQEEIKKELELETKTEEKEEIKKDKKYLRERKKKYRDLVLNAVSELNLKVKGYEGDRMQTFIDEMVGEFAGYSILEDAFNDPEVSDIFVIDWQTIFVEKAGSNQLYHKTFRSPKHYEDVLERFLDEAGKGINVGDSKIVDFEIFQDRGAATSKSASPRSASLTIRKHSEDHITRDDLIKFGAIDEKMSELLGILIKGESNIICAGITGSGKTTTIRALLDFYVTKLNKRMLVCEDTQELFPKNEHTLELVTTKSKDDALAVSLRDLIMTALRLKPKYIVVGEVRGVEAEAAVEAMETGHSTIFTMHGANVWNVINRLTTKYLTAMPSLGVDVVERIIGSGVDYVFIQENMPGIGRKVTSIVEVFYDFDKKRVGIKTIVRFDSFKKEWVWEGKIDPEKADKMLKRGVSVEEIEPWMEK